MQRDYSCVGDNGLLFLRENRNVCSTTLTERQPLKRGRQISQHLLIRPNLRSIIVPQPCRKRSVTLGDCPATHLSNFTLLSSHPLNVRLSASSGRGGNLRLLVYAVFTRKTVCLPPKRFCVLFLCASLLPLWLRQHLCCTCCYYNKPTQREHVEDITRCRP